MFLDRENHNHSGDGLHAAAPADVFKAICARDTYPACPDDYLLQVMQDVGFRLQQAITPYGKTRPDMQIYKHPAGALITRGVDPSGKGITDARLCYQWVPRDPARCAAPAFSRPFGMDLPDETGEGGMKRVMVLAAMEDPRAGLRAAMARLQDGGRLLTSWGGHHKLAVHDLMFTFFSTGADAPENRNDLVTSRIRRLDPDLMSLTHMTLVPAPFREPPRYQIPKYDQGMR